MGELEDFLVCMIKRDLTKTTLKISQPDLITKMTQGFNEDVKTGSSPRRPLFLHAIPFEWTTKL